MEGQTIECIRESMISLLQEKEYEKIQTKEIAERAHVGRKTLYIFGKECKRVYTVVLRMVSIRSRK